jgi:hypothetical protein
VTFPCLDKLRVEIKNGVFIFVGYAKGKEVILSDVNVIRIFCCCLLLKYKHFMAELQRVAF